MTMEHRAYKVDNIKTDKGNDTVEGYGIVYDQEIELFPGFYEKILPGAFLRSLSNADVIKSYFNHDSDKVLSTTRSDPALVLRDDATGLHFSSPIPPTSYGNDLKINLERKNVSGASFAFTVDAEDWEERSDGTVHRTISGGTLFEIGPVTDPAYIQTTVGLHSSIKEKYELRKKDALTIVEKNKKNEEGIEKKQKLSQAIIELEMLKLTLEKDNIHGLK